jgi:hypothetical protein
MATDDLLASVAYFFFADCADRAAARATRQFVLVQLYAHFFHTKQSFVGQGFVGAQLSLVAIALFRREALSRFP